MPGREPKVERSLKEVTDVQDRNGGVLAMLILFELHPVRFKPDAGSRQRLHGPKLL